jgi:hypothetical protein
MKLAIFVIWQWLKGDVFIGLLPLVFLTWVLIIGLVIGLIITVLK